MVGQLHFRLISGPRNVCLLEESIIDLENKSLTTYTRNVGYSSLMVCVNYTNLSFFFPTSNNMLKPFSMMHFVP